MTYNAKLFAAITSLYALHIAARYSSFSEPKFISSYFADLLCMPFTLSLFVMIVRAVKRQPTFQLSLLMIAFAVIYISFTFEYLLPKYYTWLTADPVDVAMYALGGTLYFLFQKWEMKKFSAAEPMGVQ